MKKLLLALPLALAACGSATEAPPPPDGNMVRESINAQSIAYGECVLGAIKSMEIKDRLASTLADEAFANCRSIREALLADVLRFRRIGNPSEPEASSRLTAEQSVLNLEETLREKVLAEATVRKLSDENGNNAQN